LVLFAIARPKKHDKTSAGRRGVMVFKSVKVLIATIGLSLGSAAIAEDLVYFGSDPTGTVFYIDKETIRKNLNNTVDVWIKLDESKNKTVDYNAQRAKLRIDCSDETYELRTLYLYRADGTVMKSINYEYPEMGSIPPVGHINNLFKILCT
jgi:hypothetical protein